MSTSLAKREPAALAAGITAVITTGLGLAVAFGLPVTEAQQGAILGFTGAVLALVLGTGAAVRAAVTPKVKVLEQVDGKYVIAGEANDQVSEGTVVRELNR